VTAPVVGRLAAVWGCRMSAARPDGLGAWVAGTVSTAQALVVSAAAMAVPLLLLLRDDDPRRMALPAVAAALPVALMVAGLLQRRWAARLGGITGDTLGAAVEIATTVTFVIIALAPG
jgi:adenosylcobinamide-GDP ribazoletransferase